MIGQTISQYKILEKLGEGGMGVVYKAQDTKLNRVVALKFLPERVNSDDVTRSRFLQEAQAAAVLNHPNICVIHDVREEDGKQFMVMEYVDGKTLRDFNTPGGIKTDTAIDYAIQIAEALEEAHKKGIVHRDIKADNIMVNSKNQIKVMDFGLAKLKGSLKLTRTSSTVGTLAYMAPEQMQGGDVDPRSDIFSFGVLFFEMLSGRLPFRGEHEAAMMYSIINEDPENIQKYVPDAPAELSYLLKTALEKNPEDRFQHMSDIVRDLRRLKKQSSRVNRPAFSGEYKQYESGQQHTGQPVSGDAVKTAGRGINTMVLYGAAGVMLAAMLIAGFFVFLPSESTAFSSFEFSRITSTGKIQSAAISPDNRYICYSQFDKGKYSLWVRQLAANSNIQIKTPQDMFIGDPVFSLDGNYIYYRMREPAGDLISLYKIPVLGGNSVKIISEVYGRITFSPDGSKIAFNRIYRENGNFALVVASADGSQQKDLAAYKGEKWISGNPSWSPKGDIIAVAMGLWEGGFHHELISVDAVSGEVKKLTTERWDVISNITWMSDGTGLIMEVSDLNKPGVQLSFVSYPSGESRKVTNDLNEYGGSSITTDMKKICVVLNEREMYLYFVPEGNAKKARKITQMRDDGWTGLSFAPDNTLYYVSRQGGDFDIWSIGLNSGEPQQITTDKFMESNISVTPDGQTLLFNSNISGLPNLWKISIDGTGLTQLTKGAEDYAPMMDPSGNWIVFSSWVRGPQTIMKIPAGGGDRIDVSTENGNSPALSKDGSTVYYVSNVGSKNYVSAVSINGGASRRLFEADKNMNSFIKVRPGTGELSYVITKNGVSNIVLRSAAGGPERRFTDFDELLIFNFEWTHDGRSVAVTRGELRSDVVILNEKSK